jgi:hypothetical protein
VVSVHKDIVTCDIMEKLNNDIYDIKKLFFNYNIIIFSKGEIPTDVIDSI